MVGCLTVMQQVPGSNPVPPHDPRQILSVPKWIATWNGTKGWQLYPKILRLGKKHKYVKCGKCDTDLSESVEKNWKIESGNWKTLSAKK